MSISKQNSPLVSVLMPVYNTAEFLTYAIESILNQSFSDFEFIILNDGSTDDSAEIIQRFKDPRIRYFEHSNIGVARTLNKGLDLVRGKFVRRHDSDDISDPTMLEIQLDFLRHNPDIPFVSTQIAFLSPNGKKAWAYRQPKKNYFNENESFRLANLDDFDPFSPIVHGTVLGRSDIFREMGGYRTEFLTSEDNDLWMRILDKYKFAVLNKCLYFVRLNAGSATQLHKSSLAYYHNIALSFAKERRIIGTDPLMRGEKLIYTSKDSNLIEEQITGKVFRDDLLNYNYKVAVNSKDYREVKRIVFTSIKYGWKLPLTWKSLLIPLMGPELTATVVKFKRSLNI